MPASERETAGLNRVLTVETATGRTIVQAIAPGRSVGTRGDDGPVWAPDGTSLLVAAESLVHRVPVRLDGRVSGRPRRLSDRIADAISVSADGHVLFLSLGEFVLLPPDRPGRTTRPARHGSGLTCRARPAPPRTVVRAGALWDGTGEGYRRDVDITVEDGSSPPSPPCDAAPPRSPWTPPTARSCPGSSTSTTTGTCAAGSGPGGRGRCGWRTG
ncbi:hypothetical protein [Streptomyces viridosporus]|uniref:hypothetical protein n=1 Tax=Streptomyces viridosporus TaxID=67581 RepID=UPI0036F91F1A